jgi:hypothetical protein
VRNFAIAHGKPMAFPESGAVISPNGGGDNPYFIQKEDARLHRRSGE